MRRLLVITLLEYRERPNNRIQHTVDALKGDFDEVRLLCRALPSTSGGLGAKLRNVLPWPSRVYDEGNLRIIEYNPPLNYVEGYSGEGDEGGSGSWLRSMINLLGLAREFAFIVTIAYVSLRHSRGRFHVCIVETFWEGLVAIILRRFGKVRYVVFDDNDFNPGYMVNSLRRGYETWAESWCVRSADLAIAVGSLLAEFWNQRTGREILVIPNGVDTGRFEPGESIDDGTVKRLVYIGTLSTRWVDLDIVLESMAILAKRGTDVALTVVGMGRTDYIERLKASIDRFGLNDRVEWIGRVEHHELPGVLRRCGIGLALSPGNLLRRFASPLKVIEYMAMGLPVIGNGGTETGRIIEHYGAGAAIEPDIENLVDTLSRLINDREYYLRCRSSAIEGARDFDLAALADRRREELKRRFFQEAKAEVHPS